MNKASLSAVHSKTIKINAANITLKLITVLLYQVIYVFTVAA